MFTSAKLHDIYICSKKSKSADGNDTFLMREVLFSKMGELLAKDKIDLVNTLKKRKVAVTNTSDRVILEICFDQIKRSDDYAEELVKMILRKDGVQKATTGEIKDYVKELKIIAGNADNAKKIITEYKTQWIYCDDVAKKLYADDSGENIDEKVIKWNKKRVLLCLCGLGILGYFGWRIYKYRKGVKEQENFEMKGKDGKCESLENDNVESQEDGEQKSEQNDVETEKE